MGAAAFSLTAFYPSATCLEPRLFEPQLRESKPAREKTGWFLMSQFAVNASRSRIVPPHRYQLS
jgi:hypothetical protein